MTSKRADGSAKTPRIGRQTHDELGHWLTSQGLRLDDADGVELQVATPQVDLEPHGASALTDVEATARLDAATIQKLRQAAAAARQPK